MCFLCLERDSKSIIGIVGFLFLLRCLSPTFHSSKRIVIDRNGKNVDEGWNFSKLDSLDSNWDIRKYTHIDPDMISTQHTFLINIQYGPIIIWQKSKMPKRARRESNNCLTQNTFSCNLYIYKKALFILETPSKAFDQRSYKLFRKDCYISGLISKTATSIEFLYE